MCHDVFWLRPATCRPSTDMMTCMSKQTCLAARTVGMPVSGSGYTWYDLAFGPCQCPLAWLPAVSSKSPLARNKMDWGRWRGNHHSGIIWLSATLKDKLSAGHADLTSAGTVTALPHPITASGADDDKAWNKKKKCISLKEILYVWCVWLYSKSTNL